MRNRTFFLLSSLILFFLLVLAAVCRKNSFRDNELIRRIRLRNTPEALADDLFSALDAGDMERLDALSMPRVRSMLRNEFALLYPDLSFDEAMIRWADSVKKKYGDGVFSGITLSKSENGVTASSLFTGKNGEPPVLVSFRLVRDEHGNWKNDTRL